MCFKDVGIIIVHRHTILQEHRTIQRKHSPHHYKPVTHIRTQIFFESPNYRKIGDQSFTGLGPIPVYTTEFGTNSRVGTKLAAFSKDKLVTLLQDMKKNYL